MSNDGFTSQNGTGGGTYTNGPFLSPIALQPTTQDFMEGQAGCPTIAQSKAPLTSGTNPSRPYQQATEVSMYQNPSGSSLPVMPPVGPLRPMQPSQPDPNNHRMSMSPPSQSSTTLPVSNSYYQHPQQPTSWQYGGHPQIEAPSSGIQLCPVPSPGPSQVYRMGTATPSSFHSASQSPGHSPTSASGNNLTMPAAAYPLLPGQMSKADGTVYQSLPPGYQSMLGVPKPSPVLLPPQPYSLPSQQYQQPPIGPAQLSSSLAALSLQAQAPEALRVVNLLQERNLLPPGPIPAPTPCLPQDLQKLNCNPEVFRCTLTSIPQTQSLLNKARLPLGLLLHPFKDLSQLPVVTSSSIVRCRSCRTYINPFVSFLDQRRWKCNLCYRVNDVPEEFMYNPVSRSYGEPHKRPEVQNATIEFIAPSEYMYLINDKVSRVNFFVSCCLFTGCISRYSAGSFFFYPSYHNQHNPAQTERFQKDLKRYLTRKIGFEAVMRIRCTKGLSIHTFHGNFFVRSTDLLSLPNINPDAGFAVQMSIEENLLDMQVVSFQAALLYTSSKGERRIRVHTLCLPVVNSISDIFAGADVQAITGLLASMAVDRSVTASLTDARDAMTNAVIDSLTSYRTSVLAIQQPGLLAPACLRLLPLYILGLLKQTQVFLGRKHSGQGPAPGWMTGVFAMCQLKCQPLAYLMYLVHPSLYRLDTLINEGLQNIDDHIISQPRVLQLSVEKLIREGVFLMDTGSEFYFWVGRNCNPVFLRQVLGVQSYADVPLNMNHLPELDTAESGRTRAFIGWLREQRPFYSVLHVIGEESPLKSIFMQNMIEDRTESALSYYEFLLHVQQQVSK
ncbi:hypothetical protein P4O66_016438 [Electrophorus voltai]|uniref:SEC24 homolog B, COPII coat complex component n=1 Tax=Electrophorus voltai TaxID=2609070 RepID=A0AAD8YXT7_9TELE|nr:hypothetical protein P4O66_016438 [Electrophorus voltai]